MRRIWLRISCPVCGYGRVLREHVVLTITMDDSTYAFTCPTCHQIVARTMTPRIMEVLLNTLVFDRPPITELDCVEFADELNRTEFPLAELEG